MLYTDIHSHMLCHVDDGADSQEEMFKMLEEAYRTGTRSICFTPHYNPALFGDTSDSALASFEMIKAYAAEKHPDMMFSLASELGYHVDWLAAVKTGKCRLIGDKYLLTDFPGDISLFEIRYAVDDMLSHGVSVILAHVERYGALIGEYAFLRELCRRGVLLQVNASALALKTPLRFHRHVHRLFRECPIAIVASDAHNLIARPPALDRAERILRARYGDDAAEFLLSHAPSSVMRGKTL